MRVTLFILCGILLAIPNRPTLQACGIASQQGGNGVSIASESALIVFDAKAKVQHFLRTANFDTSSSEFGFFVPTPTQPELAEASAEVFGELAKLTAPRVVEKIEHRTKMPSFGCGLAKARSGVAGAAYPLPDGGVKVLDSKRIGRFDAVVLQATDAGKLQEWLNENKYATRPALEQWFDVYIQKGWYLVAFKIAAAPGKTHATNEAIRISFPTEVPIYPYREPTDAAAFAGPQSSRLFRLFVMSDARVEGKLGTNAWDAGKIAWSKRIEEPVSKSLLNAAKVPEVSGSFVLTEFEDTSFPRKGTDDIAFPASVDQSEIQRPDVIRVTVEYDNWPTSLLCIVLGSMPFLIPMAGILIWRRIRRK